MVLYHPEGPEIRLAGISHGSRMRYRYIKLRSARDKPLSGCSVSDRTQHICPLLSGHFGLSIFGATLSCVEASPLASSAGISDSHLKCMLLQFHVEDSFLSPSAGCLSFLSKIFLCFAQIPFSLLSFLFKATFELSFLTSFSSTASLDVKCQC